MLPQSQAKIFLSGERSEVQSETYRCYGTFDPENLWSKEKQAFSSLSVLNEITLAPAQTCSIAKNNRYDYVIVPVVGTVHFETTAESDLVNPGQALFISLGVDETLEITNPYEDVLVNFIQLGFSKNNNEGKSLARTVPFDVDNNKNNLQVITSAFIAGRETAEAFPKISIGKFDGRHEMVYPLEHPGNGIFVFVIQGAFEVQYRLMESKDGLAIWDMQEMELEALSNEAIILTVEFPL